MDAYNPITTYQRLPRPLNGTIFTTTRKVSPEKPIPVLGDTMTAELGSGWAASRIISVVKSPNSTTPDTLQIQHAVIPNTTDQLDSNWEQGSVSIGGKEYDAVFRTVIILASDFNPSTPAINSEMPIGAGLKFDGMGYTFYDKETLDSGTALEPVFRVERHTFIKKAVVTDKTTGTWGEGTDTTQIVLPGDALPVGFGIKSSRQTAIGNGHAVEARENYPTPSETNIIYKLEGEEHDELTGAIIITDKWLVNAAAAKSIASNQRGAGYFTEIQPLDKWHSILIGSKLDGLPVTQTWVESGNINLPDQLMEVGVIWDADSEKTAGTAGVDNISTIISENYTWNVSAQAAISGNVSGRPYSLLKNGFQGAALVTVERSFHVGAPAIPFTPYAFNPVYGTLTIHNVSKVTSGFSKKSGIGDTSISGSASVKYSRDDKLLIQQIGPFVHAGLTLTNLGDSPTITDSVLASGGSIPGGGIYPVTTATLNITGLATLSMPLSSVPLTSGNTYILHVEVKPWRFGVWIKEVYTVTVP